MKMHRIGFVRKFDPPPEEVEMDEEQVHAALLNILENAADACTEDKSKKSHEIIFRVRHDNTHLIFEIEDNGIGMDEEKKKKIFALFFSSKATKGTGIGLFVSDKIIRQHGGTISVDSEPGQGTCFIIKIPKTQD
jgi:signal transduction histidine kinase